jgi:hypothetical protein
MRRTPAIRLLQFCREPIARDESAGIHSGTGRFPAATRENRMLSANVVRHRRRSGTSWTNLTSAIAVSSSCAYFAEPYLVSDPGGKAG